MRSLSMATTVEAVVRLYDDSEAARRKLFRHPSRRAIDGELPHPDRVMERGVGVGLAQSPHNRWLALRVRNESAPAPTATLAPIRNSLLVKARSRIGDIGSLDTKIWLRHHA